MVAEALALLDQNGAYSSAAACKLVEALDAIDREIGTAVVTQDRN